ncbi:unnamed protein product [Sphenostylis stenocarpa]|uniref:Protein RFT1 homolog n=1 Tax=Sphenostylis stenocarpa TaxID=92480 RepID=A0AA86SGB5_9FABA|nr:unnamed protein product [Sphenostylis stenocarpa]
MNLTLNVTLKSHPSHAYSTSTETHPHLPSPVANHREPLPNSNHSLTASPKPHLRETPNRSPCLEVARPLTPPSRAIITHAATMNPTASHSVSSLTTPLLGLGQDTSSNGTWAEKEWVTVLDLAASGINLQKIEDVDTFSQYSEPLLQLLATIPPNEKVILVGHSLGGFNIALAMDQFPEKVAVGVFLTAFTPDINHKPSYVLEKNIAQALIYKAKQKQRGAGRMMLPSVQGQAEGKWIVIDSGKVIVHALDEKARAYYNLEGLWTPGTIQNAPHGDFMVLLKLKLMVETIATLLRCLTMYLLIIKKIGMEKLGSLVVRLVFLPFEESSYATFARSTSGQYAGKSKILGNGLMESLKLVLLIDLVFMAFGPSYSYSLIRLLYGEKWSDGEASTALRCYCFYVIVLAMNGHVTVATPEQLATREEEGGKNILKTAMWDLELAKSLLRPASLFGEDLSQLENFSKQGYGSVPLAYIVCTEDLTISLSFQLWMIQNAAINDVLEIKGADHMPMFSKPQELCNSLLQIAAKYA